MMVYYIAYFACLTGVVSCIHPQPRWRTVLQIFLVTCAVMLLWALASGRADSVDRDYANYFAWFSSIDASMLMPADWIKDPAFIFLSVTAKFFNLGFTAVLCTMVAAALGAKIWFARETCKGQWFALFLYLVFCKFYLAHEMTQIRAAVAIPFMSISFIYGMRSRKKLAAALYLFSLILHLSMLIALPVFLLIIFGVKFRSRAWIASFAFVGAVAYGLLKNSSTLADFGRLEPYLNGSIETGTINFFSIYLISRIGALIITVLGFWNELSEEERLISCCSALGVCLQFALAANDNLALRCAEVFGLFDMLVLLMPLRHAGKRYISLAQAYLLVLLAVGAALFASSLRIVQPYSINRSLLN